jgi:transcriptional regulator with XRE-family HTH domain
VAKNNDRSLDAAIGARIRTLRLHHKLSQGKLAEKVGVTFQQIQKYEQGSNQINPTRLLRFANVLGVSAGPPTYQRNHSRFSFRVFDPIMNRSCAQRPEFVVRVDFPLRLLPCMHGRLAAPRRRMQRRRGRSAERTPARSPSRTPWLRIRRP